VKSLVGKVALVTGASRGIGKGIALGLGEAGATVYITGRTVEEGKAAVALPGTIHQTANEVTQLGGKCIAVQCDHRIDQEVEAVFQAGVRAHYVASVLAAPLMIARHTGLIVNLSFFVAQRDDKGVAYGVAKAASDRMAACMAYELREHHIAVVSLYPGLVRTESVMKAAEYFDLSNSESPQFIGRAVAALASDSDIMQKSGRVLVAAALAQGFTDVDGKQPRPLTVKEI
jgi:dehydrogenase/reductase SDR family protein 1